MPTLRQTRTTVRILECLLNSPHVESCATAIGNRTGMPTNTVYRVLHRLTQHRILEVSRKVPSSSGPAHRNVRFTPQGWELAAEWGLVTPTTLAAHRLRAISAALRLPVPNALLRAAAQLELHKPGESRPELAALAEAVLGVGGHQR